MFDEFESHELMVLLRNGTLACMEKYGHADTYIPEPAPPPVSKHNERRYGITDGRLAKRLGFRADQGDAAPREKEKPLTADEEFTITGGSSKPGEPGKGGRNEAGKDVPPGGCKGQALKALGYSPTATPGNPAMVQNLDLESFDASLRTDSVKQALRDWSACMRDKGYTYDAEPFSASNDRRFATPAATEAEKEVAMADVECKNSSRLIEIWKAEETRIQKSLTARNRQELEKVAKQRDTTLSLIKELSGTSS